jgi:hypothetical protein
MGLEGERAQLVPSLLSGVRATPFMSSQWTAHGTAFQHAMRAATVGEPPIATQELSQASRLYLRTLCDGSRGPLKRSERDDLNTAPPAWSSSKSHPAFRSPEAGTCGWDHERRVTAPKSCRLSAKTRHPRPTHPGRRHERGKDGRDSLFRCFGVSFFCAARSAGSDFGSQSASSSFLSAAVPSRALPIA